MNGFRRNDEAASCKKEEEIAKQLESARWLRVGSDSVILTVSIHAHHEWNIIFMQRRNALKYYFKHKKCIYFVAALNISDKMNEREIMFIMSVEVLLTGKTLKTVLFNIAVPLLFLFYFFFIVNTILCELLSVILLSISSL